MNKLHDSLQIKITFEYAQIEKELQIIKMLKQILISGNMDGLQLRAAASSLHSIYNGVEKVLLMKLKYQGITIISDGNWYASLLQKATKNSIISPVLEMELKELMGFRHFYRHSYGFMLDKDLLQPLILQVNAVFDRFVKEIG